MEESLKNLIQKFVAGDCSPQEVANLVAYIENTEKDSDFPGVEEVLVLLEEIPELDEKEADEVYARIVKRIQVQETSLALKTKRKRSYKKYAAIAALFIAFLGGVAYYTVTNTNQSTENVVFNTRTEDAIRLETGNGEEQLISSDSHLKLTNSQGALVGVQKDSVLHYKSSEKMVQKIEYNTLHVPYGKRFQIQLADGSQVHMNAGSSLKYPVNFPQEGEREVFLTGEAFFEVAKDKEHPFVVKANDLDIEVLGTKFNVSAYREDNSTEVVLVEGSVELADQEDEMEPAQLTPGQFAAYLGAEKSLAIREVDTRLYTSWMHGELIFRNERLGNILKKMERHYNVTIINNAPDQTKEKFNASFDDEPLEKILKYFKKAYGLDFTKKKKDTFIIGSTREQ